MSNLPQTRMKNLPVARDRDVVIQRLDNELLIYDIKTQKAYCLNKTTSSVYDACDGETSFDSLKHNTGLTDEIVFFALDELRKEDLLAEGQEYGSPFVGMSRRDVIKKVGMASMIALPVIASLVAPTAAMAASLLPQGAACTTSLSCASNFCTDSVCCESSCSGVCESCNQAGRLGFCDATPSPCI